MASVLRSAVKAIKEKGLLNFVRELKNEGYTKCLLDGNLLQTKLHSIGAKVVGTHQFGNNHYECMENTQFGRHRWVEFADKSPYNPTEWHGWLHHITDHTGDEKIREEQIDNRSGGSGNMDVGSGGDQDDHSRNKRYHRHTANQTQKMKAFFQKNQYPDEKERLKLSLEIGLKPCQVKFWFQNRRTRLKSQRDRVDYQALKSHTCGGPVQMLGELSFDVQLRLQNARLKELIVWLKKKLQLAFSIASRHTSRRPSVFSSVHPGLQSSLDLDMAEIRDLASPLRRRTSQRDRVDYQALKSNTCGGPVQMLGELSFDVQLRLMQLRLEIACLKEELVLLREKLQQVFNIPSRHTSRRPSVFSSVHPGLQPPAVQPSLDLDMGELRDLASRLRRRTVGARPRHAACCCPSRRIAIVAVARNTDS